jgi:magnesium transporter
MLDPTDQERLNVSEQYKIEVPSRETLAEIEASSRLFSRNNLVCVSMPLLPAKETDDPTPPPLGFVLSPELLVTVRFSEVLGFAPVTALFETTAAPTTSVDTFVLLLEAMVDVGADVLERSAHDVAIISRRSFRQYATADRRKDKSTGTLRATLTEVGSTGEHLSQVRETLLGLQRIASFVPDAAREWLPKEASVRLHTVVRDLQSLADFETHLSNKVQFLLDAVLGFISTEQNDIFKVLTIASVVGIPPMLIASIYGMNFRNMPELSWAWGYPFGLALILFSTIVPILWFKSRGWW